MKSKKDIPKVFDDNEKTAGAIILGLIMFLFIVLCLVWIMYP